MIRQRLTASQIQKKTILHIGLILPMLPLWLYATATNDIDRISRECFLIYGIIFTILYIAYIFSRLTKILEYDEKSLYIIKICYFKQVIDKCISIKEITEILFTGQEKFYVTIKYGNEQSYISCTKNDEIYNFLFNLGKERNILRQEKQSVKHKSKKQILSEFLIAYEIIACIYITNSFMLWLFLLSYIFPLSFLLLLFIMLFKLKKASNKLWVVLNFLSQYILILAAILIIITIPTIYTEGMAILLLIPLFISIIPVILAIIIYLSNMPIPLITDD